MKKIIILTGTLLISTSTLAMAGSTSLSQSLGAAWKSNTTIATPHHDLNIVYGGADISRRPTSIHHTTTA
jgi:hypothetical protein